MSTSEERLVTAEYAKSARGVCKAKKNCVIDPEGKIAKGGLKIGIRYRVKDHDVFAFKHFECQPASFLKSHLPNGPDSLLGFQDLKAEDQLKIKTRFEHLNEEIEEIAVQKAAKASKKAAERKERQGVSKKKKVEKVEE